MTTYRLLCICTAVLTGALALVAMTPAAMAQQAVSSYDIVHNVRVWSWNPSVIGGQGVWRDYEHAWAGEPGSPSQASYSPLAQNPGYQPFGWDWQGRWGAVRNGNVWVVMNDTRFWLPPQYNGGPSTVNAASGNSWASASASASANFQGGVVSGTMRAWGTAVAAAPSASAYAFSSSNLILWGATVDWWSGRIRWTPGYRSSSSGRAVATVPLPRPRDPIVIRILCPDDNVMLEESLVDIYHVVTGGDDVEVAWENGRLQSSGVSSGEFRAILESPFVDPAQCGRAELNIENGLVVYSFDTGIFEGLLPAVGTPGTFDVPFPESLEFDYSFPQMGPTMEFEFGNGLAETPDEPPPPCRDYFQLTGGGSMNLYRGGGAEGYTNAGQQGTPRIFKADQHAGWMTFAGTVGDNTGLTLAEFLAANPTAKGTLYFRTNEALPAPGGGALPVGAVISSIRSGNEGALVEDQGTTGSYAYTAPAPGYQGASELQAFRGCLVPPAGFSMFGAGIYVNQNPLPPGPNQGTPWIAPKGRLPAGRNGFIFGPGQAIQYDIDNDGNNGLTGFFDGYQQDGAQGANFWAFEDLLGVRQNNGFLPSAAQAYNSGQILVGGLASPTVVNLNQAVGTLDPRNKNNDNTDDNWYAVPIDAAFLQDIASGPEHKGLVFLSNTGLTTANWGNQGFYAREQFGGIYEPYLAIGIPVRIAGDVDGDGCVDIFDVIDTVTAFGTVPGDPLWNPGADFDGNGMVDIFDVIDAVTNFGQCAP